MNAPAPLTRAALCRLRAQDVVLQHTAMAGASMAIPLPLLDMATGLAIQIRMVKKLCALYGAEFKRSTARDVITGILGGLSTRSLSATTLRYVSYAGYFAGTLPSVGLSAAYTYALGRLLLERLATHGRIDLPAPSETALSESTLPASTPSETTLTKAAEAA